MSLCYYVKRGGESIERDQVPMVEEYIVAERGIDSISICCFLVRIQLSGINTA